MNVNRRQRANQTSENSELPTTDSGLLNERVLLLLFSSINWDPHILGLISCVNRKLSAVAKRVLWKELCATRAPRMVPALIKDEPHLRVGDGWHALAKLLFFCCGCVSTPHFKIDRTVDGHFLKSSRFSKTSGQSFLVQRCQSDLLYISDPCEHSVQGNCDDLGVFRGVFKGFMKSKTRSYLIGRKIEFEQRTRCPYCGQRVWSMTTARLVPKAAAKRLGSHHEKLEYFVCVNGHLHGTCLLVPLSSEDEEFDDGAVDDIVDESGNENLTVKGALHNGARSSSSGEEIWERPAADGSCIERDGSVTWLMTKEDVYES